MQKSIIILTLISVLLFSNGCNNKSASNVISLYESEQSVDLSDNDSYEDNTTNDNIDAGKIKQTTDTISDEPDIPKWDIKNNNILNFNFKFEGQKKNYKFIAPEDGIYRFLFEIDNVEEYYSVELCKKNHEIIQTFNSNNDKNIELQKNEEYIIVFSQENGLPECSVKIFIPNPIINIDDNIIQGTINYTGQEDTYLYKAISNGKYGFKLDISNANYSYGIQILDSKNNTVVDSNYYSSQNNDNYINANLSYENTYKIKVNFYSSLNDENFDYSIEIHNPNLPSKIDSPTIDGEFNFGGQENIYYYTPKKSGSYYLVFNDNNEPMQYKVSFSDEKKHLQGPKSNHSTSASFELIAGEEYEITVIQVNDYGNYHINIKEKLE